MLVLPGVVTSVVLLYYLGLLIEELGLLILVLGLLHVHKLAATVIASQNSLDGETGLDFVVVLPLDLEHPPVFLDSKCLCVFLEAVLLGLVYHVVVGVDDVSLTVLPSLQIQSHNYQINYIF